MINQLIRKRTLTLLVFGVSLGLGILITSLVPTTKASSDDDDADDTLVFLTDEPGNWFRSEATGTPLSVVNAGDTVEFEIDDDHTDTLHTVTLLLKPDGSNANIDMDEADDGKIELEVLNQGRY